jgi:hypothetical protein
MSHNGPVASLRATANLTELVQEHCEQASPLALVLLEPASHRSSVAPVGARILASFLERGKSFTPPIGLSAPQGRARPWPRVSSFGAAEIASFVVPPRRRPRQTQSAALDHSCPCQAAHRATRAIVVARVFELGRQPTSSPFAVAALVRFSAAAALFLRTSARRFSVGNVPDVARSRNAASHFGSGKPRPGRANR